MEILKIIALCLANIGLVVVIATLLLMMPGVLRVMRGDGSKP